MVLKKLDNRLRVLIENGVTLGHRSMFVIVGEKARDQVVILHQMLSKAQIKARPSVLWCFKNSLGFTTHRQKRMREIEKKKKMGLEPNENDLFELFISSTNIRWCYYRETHNILGNTFGMLVLQDFEAITPNVLARTIETIEGGGIVCLLLNSLTSLRQLYTMTMDVHDRFRTESHKHVVPRFNERFILSLSSCKKCVVIDDSLNVLPISSHIANIKPVPKPDSETQLSEEENKLKELKTSLADTQPISSLVNCCKTFDQGKALLKFIDAISDKTLRATVSLTAARGRGKSAALGLAISAAVAFNYSNIFVTSPSPENLKTLFDFILKGFDAIHLQEHLDYEIIQSTNPEFNKSIIRINVFKDHRQTIQYIHPNDAKKNKLLCQSAELVVIDEAAAIPLPIVKSLLGPYLVFMSSTINGYEGTGRSLSLKLIKQLREQCSSFSGAKAKHKSQEMENTFNRVLHEVTLDESIRYKNGDDVESWLYKLLCLDTYNPKRDISPGCPEPNECQLYYINRDTLFSFHKDSETFLQKLMALYVSSHYKNTPNDLQMMSDAPAHHLFCLLPSMSASQKMKGKIPEVLCFIQICFEGEISKDSIMSGLNKGQRPFGDVLPWTISQQFQDTQFGSLSGARVVRIATNPNYQRMGYGTAALKQLEDYFKGNLNVDLNEENTEKVDEKKTTLQETDEIAPRKELPPLLSELKERKAERLDYLGVSYGMTENLFKFWKTSGFVPVYLRQTPNNITGEYTCMMLKLLSDDSEYNDSEHVAKKMNGNWLKDFWLDFKRRFISLLSFEFRKLPSPLALRILDYQNFRNLESSRVLRKEDLDSDLSLYDLKRLEMYSSNLVDYHLIMDLIPKISEYYFMNRLGSEFNLSPAQCLILLSLGLQRKSVDDIIEEMNLSNTQIMGLFIRVVKKITTFLRNIEEKAVEDKLGFGHLDTKQSMRPIGESLDEELEAAAQNIIKDEKRNFKRLSEDLRCLSQYAIKGNEDDWDKALNTKEKSLISIKSIMQKDHNQQMTIDDKETKRKSFNSKGKKKKQRKN